MGSSLIYGARFQVYPDDILPAATLNVFGLYLPLMRVLIVLASVLMMIALYLFIQKTKIGTAIRAAAIDQGAARLMGIDVNRVILLVFLVGPALGGVAGLMVGLYYGQINFTMGWIYGMKAFTAAILGGIGKTLFLNLFHGGKLKAMPPKLLSDDGQHVVIRPLAYCKERDLAAYAEACQFPIIPCNLCGSQENLQRQAIKSMLRQWEKQFPGRVENIFAALGNVAPSHLADTGLFDFAGLGARNGGQAPNWLPGGHEEDEEETPTTLVNNHSVEIRIPWLAVRQV